MCAHTQEHRLVVHRVSSSSAREHEAGAAQPAAPDPAGVVAPAPNNAANGTGGSDDGTPHAGTRPPPSTAADEEAGSEAEEEAAWEAEARALLSTPPSTAGHAATPPGHGAARAASPSELLGARPRAPPRALRAFNCAPSASKGVAAVRALGLVGAGGEAVAAFFALNDGKLEQAKVSAPRGPVAEPAPPLTQIVPTPPLPHAD